MESVAKQVHLQHISLRIKLDTNWPVGAVGAKVKCGQTVVGIFSSRNYGCVMIDLGGSHLLKGEAGGEIARLMAGFVDGEPLSLQVEGGSRLYLKRGEVPLIDGEESGAVKVGCGSAVLATFAHHLKDAADEVIVVDPEIGGLFTENSSGRALGLQFSGVIPRAKRYYAGRYHFPRGSGWGGTVVRSASDAVDRVNMEHGRPGMTILVIENTGHNFGLLKVNPDGTASPVEPTVAATQVAQMVAQNSQSSHVSGLLLFSLAEAGIAGATLNGLHLGGAPLQTIYSDGQTVVVNVDQIEQPGSVSASGLPAGLVLSIESGTVVRTA